MSPDRSSHTLRFLESHPFSTGVTIFIVIVFLGWIFSLRAHSTSSSVTLRAWGGTLPINTDTEAPANAAPTTIESVSATDTAVLARPIADELPAPATASGNSGFDAFFAQLSRQANAYPAATTTIADQIQAAFSNVPTLPANFGASGAVKMRTPEQAALFSYGNAAGTTIKTFEATHLDEQRVLEAQAKDRGDTASADKLRALARDLGSIGTQLRAITAVPPSAAAANDALATSYENLGAKLGAVANAGTDDAKALSAIRAYDASADAFVGSYTALVDLFAITGVTFSNTDPGNAFTFTATNGVALH